MFAATALSTSCRPSGLVSTQRRSVQRATTARRAQLVTRAMLPAEVFQLAAEAAPGTVDAPIGVIIGGAVVVTALSFLVSLGLKPGTDAAIDMQQRDKKKFNKYDK